VGMNPREREARGKDSVKCVTSCYVDLALAELSSTVDHLVGHLCWI
jgi:hypothetical protein